jgi:plastocyanin
MPARAAEPFRRPMFTRRITMNPRIRNAVVAAVLCAGSFSATVMAGPEKITFPKDYEKWERYAVVDRYDNKQYRELYTSPEVVKSVRAGKPIPNGTVVAMAIYAAEVDDKGAPVKDDKGRFRKAKLTGVTVMEKREGFGAEYPAELRNGNWEYASFLPDGTANPAAADTKPCFACHKPHEKQDFVISLASLAGKFPTAAVAAKSGATDVNINGFSFGPGTMSVKKGQSINWTNGDDSPHQVSVASKSLKTSVLLKGQTGQLKFDEAGSYDYACALHPGMKGKIEVTE